MSIIADIGAAGLRAAQTRFEARAQNIANASTPGYTAVKPEQSSTPVGPVVRVSRAIRDQEDPRGPAVDIASELVDAQAAKREFQASAEIIRTDQKLNDSLLDILV